MAQEVEFLSLDVETQNLIHTSLAAREKAYCPYSNFKVGCSILCSDGAIITGCNVENSSYGLSICAERNALTSAIASGKHTFKVIVVSGDLGDSFLPPCGACRQFMIEFGPDIEVYLVKPKLDTVLRMTSGFLLPLHVNITQLGDVVKKNYS